MLSTWKGSPNSGASIPTNESGNILIKTYIGSSINVDPICPGQMDLAISSYKNKIDIAVNKIKLEHTISDVKSLFDVVKAHQYKIELLEEKADAMWKMIECLAEPESAISISGKAIQFGGELLVHSPFVAFAAPIILLGSGVRLWESSRVDALSERNLAYGRALFLDNVSCNLLNDKINVAFSRIEENEERKEKFEEWINEKELRIEMVEEVMVGGDKIYYGINFFDVYNVNDFSKNEFLMGIIAPYVHNGMIYMTYVAINFRDKSFRVKEDCFLKQEFQQTINCLKNETERNGLKLRYVSCSPFMTECETVRSRLKKMCGTFGQRLPDDPISARRLIHQYLHNGADIQE